MEPDMNDQGQPRPDWTVVLRRQPTRIVEGRPEGGYTDEFEIICCDCGDDPGLDYREVSPALQRIRGPYPIAAGITAYVQHVRQHPEPQRIHPSGRHPVREADRCPPVASSRGSSLGQPGAGTVSGQVQHAQTIRRDPAPAERR
jgi:hypothetical protein